ncbi:MAG: MFS transporter [Firmicutes bacterium]|nr:MFS transporter [Bacillota bacterium]
MQKTTLVEKIGYGFASLGDATAYGFIGVFLLFFLTTIAGISPATAGTIAAVGAIWNAIVNPIMGYIADKVHTRWGRRRPMMLAFSIPLALGMFLVFTNVDLPENIKPIYYGLLVMLYWTGYTGFFVPYLALGADYTTDYDDRTILRLFGSFFNMLGATLSMVMPTIIVDFLEGLGMTSEDAWSKTALLLGVIAAITIVITVIAAKNKDLPCEKPEKEEIHITKEIANIFREYGEVAMLKPMKYLIVASLCSLVTYTMIMSDMVYMFTYNLGLNAGQISACLLARTLLGGALIPVVGKIVLKTDKRETLIGFYLLGTVGMILIKFVGITGFAGLCVYLFFATICTIVYWQIMPSVFYDMCEYDRVTTGKNRTATIVSFQGLVEAVAVGVGGQVLGWILEWAGFSGDAEVQSSLAMTWIENSGTIIPIIFLMVAAVALYKYPINKKVYNDLINSRKEEL